MQQLYGLNNQNNSMNKNTNLAECGAGCGTQHDSIITAEDVERSSTLEASDIGREAQFNANPDDYDMDSEEFNDWMDTAEVGDTTELSNSETITRIL